MTSNVRISHNNFPVKVETLDNGAVVSTEIVLVGDSHIDRYITTTRQLRFIDLDDKHPEVIEEKKRRIAKLQAQVDAATPKDAA